MESGRKPATTLGFLIHDVARLLRRRFNALAQDLGLTQAQWQALSCIARNEGITQVQLADILEVQPICVARLIDRMEASGWVERRRDPADRRAFNLYLTGKADPILEQIWELAARNREVALTGISEEDRRTMFDNLTVMRRNLVEHGCRCHKSGNVQEE